ncbi:unnamed protein product, partial [Rotaria sp. Silwood2]
MNVAVTEFCYACLSQSNISSHRIPLCVPDTLAIDNGF